MMRKRPLIGMHLSQIGIGLSIGGLALDCEMGLRLADW